MYYQFTVRINGSGDTLEDAWQEATEYFSLDPGSPPMSDETSEYCLLDDDMQPIKQPEPKSIKVEVRGGVAYCDDPRVEIIDYDNH
ncbi:MAG: hypothetical protein IMZ61_14010 [Planctomycetes bacterium]|nr:hypothetical protein [Planctomycetota bacterium]